MAHPSASSPLPAADAAGASAAAPSTEAIDQFLSHVSHELRTPLSALLLWTRLLEDNESEVPEPLLDAVDAIQRSARELQTAVEDLVDTARVLAGKVQLDIRACPVDATVQSAIEDRRSAVDEKRVQLRYEGDSAVEAVHADPARWKQMVARLLEHALEVTPPGGRVHVGTRREGEEVLLSVVDGGGQLAEDVLHQLAEPTMVPRGGRPAKTGIALAFVRHLAERHGGSFTVQNDPGHAGLRCTLRLGACAEDPVEATPAPAAARPTLDGRRVLVIEDAADTRSALAALLTRAGADVTSAATSAQALDVYRQRRPDLIVSDLALPKMDGYELLRQFRRWEQADGAPAVPAVAVTGYTGERVRRRAIESGFQACLPKPIDPDRFLSTLAALHPPV